MRYNEACLNSVWEQSRTLTWPLVCVSFPRAPLSVSPLTMAYHHKMFCLSPGLSLLDEDKGKTFCLDHREIFFWLCVLNGKCIQQKSCEMRSGTYVPCSVHGQSAFPSVILSACLSLSIFLDKYVLTVHTALQTHVSPPLGHGSLGARFPRGCMVCTA